MSGARRRERPAWFEAVHWRHRCVPTFKARRRKAALTSSFEAVEGRPSTACGSVKARLLMYQRRGLGSVRRQAAAAAAAVWRAKPQQRAATFPPLWTSRIGWCGCELQACGSS